MILAGCPYNFLAYFFYETITFTHSCLCNKYRQIVFTGKMLQWLGIFLEICQQIGVEDFKSLQDVKETRQKSISHTPPLKAAECGSICSNGLF